MKSRKTSDAEDSRREADEGQTQPSGPLTSADGSAPGVPPISPYGPLGDRGEPDMPVSPRHPTGGRGKLDKR